MGENNEGAALLLDTYVSLNRNVRLQKCSNALTRDDIPVCTCMPASQGGSSCSIGSQCLNRCAQNEQAVPFAATHAHYN